MTSKKQEEKIEEKQEPKVKQEKKQEETPSPKENKSSKKPSKKTPSPKKENKDNTELSTLVDLVESLEDKENIFLRLSMCNYFNQYMEEVEYRRKGYEIAPYIRVDEFNKKMGE